MFCVRTLGGPKPRIVRSRRNGQHSRKRRDMVSMVIEFHFAGREKEIGALWKEKFFFLSLSVQATVSIRHTGTNHLSQATSTHYFLVTSTGINVLYGKFFPLAIAAGVAADRDISERRDVQKKW